MADQIQTHSAFIDEKHWAHDDNDVIDQTIDVQGNSHSRHNILLNQF